MTSYTTSESRRLSTVSKLSLSSPNGADSDIFWANYDVQGIKTPNGIAIFDGFVYVCNPELATVSKIDLEDPAGLDS